MVRYAGRGRPTDGDMGRKKKEVKDQDDGLTDALLSFRSEKDRF